MVIEKPCAGLFPIENKKSTIGNRQSRLYSVIAWGIAFLRDIRFLKIPC
jgi:hypothetical protein